MEQSSSETPLRGAGGTFAAAGSDWPGWRNHAARVKGSVPDVSSPAGAGLPSSLLRPGDAAQRPMPPAHRHRPPSRAGEGESPSSSSSSAGPPHAPSSEPLTFWAWLGRELGWGLALPWRRKARPAQHVVNFLSVPLRLEPLLSFGHALCADMFLFHFTSLPLRCMWAMMALAGLVVQLV